MKSAKFYQISKAVVFVACFSIVIYMAKEEIARFWANNDTSSVSIKRFHTQPENGNQFPTFSICLQHGYVMYSAKEFQKDPETTTKNVKTKIRNYRDIVEGFTPYNHKMMAKYPTFSSLTIQLKDLINRYSIQEKYSSIVERWNNSMSNQDFPFVVSYQTPRLICFTLEDKLSTNISKIRDVINFRNSALNELVWTENKNKHPGWIYLYIHAQGQLIRNLDKPIFSLHYDSDSFKGQATVSVKRVDVLRNRKDGNIPCKLYDTNEDMEYLDTVVGQFRCVPVYWQYLNISHGHFPICNSTTQYQTLNSWINGYYPTPKFWVELKWAPCYEMVVTSVLNMKSLNNTRIIMTYQDLGSRYFETVNSRDFGFENLWSSFGGIVGIFLGLSIINVFEIMSNGVGWIYDKFEKQNQY